MGEKEKGRAGKEREGREGEERASHTPDASRLANLGPALDITQRSCARWGVVPRV